MESLKRMKTLKNNTLLCLEDFYPYPFDEVQHFADDHISASLLDQRVFNKTGIYIYGFSC
jgi:hypothetical protein